MCILPALFLVINICMFEVRGIWEPMKGKKNTIPHNSFVLKPSVTPVSAG